MKQLLLLLLFPCLALAQYPGNGNQKISLGEQTTADGLVYRGLAADTTRKPSVDTMAFILLDTNTNIIWQYKKATNNAWTRVGGSISSGLTGELPVANGGTGASSFSPNNYLIRTNSSGIFDTSAIYEANGFVGFNNSSPTQPIDILTNANQGIILGRLSNNSSKEGSLILRHYNTAEENIAGITLAVDNGVNNILLGGGSSGLNAATGLFFYTAANSTTTSGSLRMRINTSGNIAFGTFDPTAVLHLKAGTATASTAPLKFTSGTNLASPLGGEMEFNGTNLFFSPSTTRHTVNHGLTGSATLNFASTNAQNSRDMTIAVTGAADGDVVSLGVPNAAVNANTSYSAWVSAANTVTVRFNNYSSGTVDPASGLFKVFVTK